MKIATLMSIDVDAIKRIMPGAEVVRVESADDLLRESKDAEIVFGVRPSILEQILQHSSTLKWAHTSTAGADSYLSDPLREGRVRLTCAKGGPAGRNLAEHALGLALALSRNIGEAARSRHWRRAELSPGAFELSGKTAGIAGYGAAGRAMAALLSGFDMRIRAVKRTPPYRDGEDSWIGPPDRLTDLCDESDVVFNFLPATPETHNIFDASMFAAMKNTALFINVGRGSTVDTSALVEALRRGSLAGAGIDAVEPEPLPEEHPLWSMSNVVISPHIAGVSPDRGIRNHELMLENLRRYRDGEPLLNVVDPEAGY